MGQSPVTLSRGEALQHGGVPAEKEQDALMPQVLKGELGVGVGPVKEGEVQLPWSSRTERSWWEPSAGSTWMWGYFL